MDGEPKSWSVLLVGLVNVVSVIGGSWETLGPDTLLTPDPGAKVLVASML